jgi:hypothetical protein
MTTSLYNLWTWRIHRYSKEQSYASWTPTTAGTKLIANLTMLQQWCWSLAKTRASPVTIIDAVYDATKAAVNRTVFSRAIFARGTKHKQYLAQIGPPTTSSSIR